VDLAIGAAGDCDCANVIQRTGGGWQATIIKSRRSGDGQRIEAQGPAGVIAAQNRHLARIE